MKIKIQNLSGSALDWAVANCEGLSIKLDPLGSGNPENGGHWIWDENETISKYKYSKIGSSYSPSTDWAQGGLIIEREKITVQTDPTDPHPEQWSAYLRANLFTNDGSDCFRDGSTPLIAAMRCYVASKIGETIEIPKELIK